MTSIGLTKNELDQFIISEVRSFIRNGFVGESISSVLNEVAELAHLGGITTVATKPWGDTKSENIIKNLYKLQKLRRYRETDEETKVQPGIYMLDLEAGAQSDTLHFEDGHKVFSYGTHGEEGRVMGYRVFDTGIQLFSSVADAKGSGKDMVGKIIFKKNLANASRPYTAFTKVNPANIEKKQKQKNQEIEKQWFEAGTWSNIIGHTLLDIAGFVNAYGIGLTADFCNAFWYYNEGEYIYAALSLLAMIPGAGEVIAVPLKFMFKTAVTMLKEVGSIGKALKEILWYLYYKFKAGPEMIDFIRDSWSSLTSIVEKGFNALKKGGDISGTDVEVALKAIKNGMQAGKNTLDDIYEAALKGQDASQGKIKQGSGKYNTSATSIDPSIFNSTSKSWAYLNNYVRRWSSLTFDESSKQAINHWVRLYEKGKSSTIPIVPGLSKAASFLSKIYTVSTPAKNVVAIMNSMKRAFSAAMINSYKISGPGGGLFKMLDEFAKSGSRLQDEFSKFIARLNSDSKLAAEYIKFAKKPFVDALETAKNAASRYGYDASRIPARDLNYVTIQVKNRIHSIGGFKVRQLSMQDFFDLIKPGTPSSAKIEDVVLLGKNNELIKYNAGYIRFFYEYLEKTAEGADILHKYIVKQMEAGNPIYLEYMTNPINKLAGAITKRAGDYGEAANAMKQAWLLDSRKWAKIFTKNLSATTQIITSTGIAAQDSTQRGKATTTSSTYIQPLYNAINWLENDPQAQQSLIGMFYTTYLKDNQTVQDIQKVKDEMAKDARKLLQPQEKLGTY